MQLPQICLVSSICAPYSVDSSNLSHNLRRKSNFKPSASTLKVENAMLGMDTPTMASLVQNVLMMASTIYQDVVTHMVVLNWTETHEADGINN